MNIIPNSLCVISHNEDITWVLHVVVQNVVGPSLEESVESVDKNRNHTQFNCLN